jgi:hypothetical protein
MCRFPAASPCSCRSRTPEPCRPIHGVMGRRTVRAAVGTEARHGTALHSDQVGLRTRAGLELPLNTDVPEERLHGVASYGLRRPRGLLGAAIEWRFQLDDVAPGSRPVRTLFRAASARPAAPSTDASSREEGSPTIDRSAAGGRAIARARVALRKSLRRARIPPPVRKQA